VNKAQLTEAVAAATDVSKARVGLEKITIKKNINNFR